MAVDQADRRAGVHAGARRQDRRAIGCAGGRALIRELERIRDDNLVAILQALRAQGNGEGWGAGKLLKDHEDRLFERAHAGAAARPHDTAEPLRLYETRVPPDWTDYNGHMSESRYLQAFGNATDALLLFAGVDKAHRDRGGSFYTVETHLVHKREARALEPIHVTTQVLAADGKRLHLFHMLHHTGTGDVLATAEHMLLHVDTKAGRAAPAEPAIAARLGEIAGAHATLPRPADAGRSVGERRG
jgi:carnitine 3-dehydrogenase